MSETIQVHEQRVDTVLALIEQELNDLQAENDEFHERMNRQVRRLRNMKDTLLIPSLFPASDDAGDDENPQPERMETPNE